jgi:hypothetical protein
VISRLGPLIRRWEMAKDRTRPQAAGRPSLTIASVPFWAQKCQPSWISTTPTQFDSFLARSLQPHAQRGGVMSLPSAHLHGSPLLRASALSPSHSWSCRLNPQRFCEWLKERGVIVPLPNLRSSGLLGHAIVLPDSRRAAG